MAFRTSLLRSRSAFTIAADSPALPDQRESFSIQPYLEKAQQQFQQSGMLPDPPPFYEQVVRGAAQAGETTFLDVDVQAGRYALVCFVDDQPIWRAYAAAQLDVTE